MASTVAVLSIAFVLSDFSCLPLATSRYSTDTPIFSVSTKKYYDDDERESLRENIT